MAYSAVFAQAPMVEQVALPHVLASNGTIIDDDRPSSARAVDPSA